MPDLSAYIDFSVVLDYNTSELRVTDTSNYPGGVSELVNGSVEVTQPDQLVTQGSFSDISFQGSALTVAAKELRTDFKGQPQNGTYKITYTVRAAGYEDTVITKTFNLQYKSPAQDIIKALDVFTPQLSLIDSSNYVQSGLLLQSVEREWDIVSPIGTTGGTGQSVDVSYGGQYYDATYSASLRSVVEYDINTWATIRYVVQKSVSFQVKTPPTIAQLRQGLVELKERIDDCDPDSDDYQLASSVFQNLLDRGRSGDLDGLYLYIDQLQKLFNDDVTPVYVNTNAPIPPYDWGVSAVGQVEWDDVLNKPVPVEIYFRVGQPGAPAAGTSTYSNSQFEGKKLIVSRNYLTQWPANPGDGNSYYERLGNQVTFYGALLDGDAIHIIAL